MSVGTLRAIRTSRSGLRVTVFGIPLLVGAVLVLAIGGIQLPSRTVLIGAGGYLCGLWLPAAYRLSVVEDFVVLSDEEFGSRKYAGPRERPVQYLVLPVLLLAVHFRGVRDYLWLGGIFLAWVGLRLLDGVQAGSPNRRQILHRVLPRSVVDGLFLVGGMLLLPIFDFVSPRPLVAGALGIVGGAVSLASATLAE